MSRDPLLSFVIPVYKKDPEVFEQCLKSLFDMSFKDFEVICVFDGEDELLEGVASRYKTKRLTIGHGGAPRARNEGFKQTHGKYVSFWDADCFAKPEMARIWMDRFEKSPELDFVYSGYEFTNEQGGIPGEPFDAYLLTCYNYIATMFPMKREVFPGFDQSLQAGQDWDLWLTIVERGGKGMWIQGYGFSTPMPDRDSISGRGWNPEARPRTIAAIRAKHHIPERRICLTAGMHKVKAIHLAKLLEADFQQAPSQYPHNYQMVINLGFNLDEIRFKNAPEHCIKIQYWMPWDIDAMEQIAYRSAKQYLENARKEVTWHLCNEIVSQKRLADLGIDADVLPLPTEVDDLETKLPDDFRVLLDVDKTYAPIFKTLPQDLPYIAIDSLENSADITKYSLLLSFHEHPTIDEGIRRFLLNGRRVISNVQAPYCGYLDLDVGYEAFKNELIQTIRDMRFKSFYQEAQDYYKKILDPKLFTQPILAKLAPPFEVLS